MQKYKLIRVSWLRNSRHTTKIPSEEGENDKAM
jgi:hypothetical protein